MWNRNGWALPPRALKSPLLGSMPRMAQILSVRHSRLEAKHMNVDHGRAHKPLHSSPAKNNAWLVGGIMIDETHIFGRWREHRGAPSLVTGSETTT